MLTFIVDLNRIYVSLSGLSHHAILIRLLKWDYDIFHMVGSFWDTKLLFLVKWARRDGKVAPSVPPHLLFCRFGHLCI